MLYSIFCYLILFLDAHQGSLTLIIFLFGLFEWRKTHIKERESDFYVGILEKIIALRYSILEIRQPRFLPMDINKDFVEKEINPVVSQIMSDSYLILKCLSSREEINKKSRKFGCGYLRCVFKIFKTYNACEDESNKSLTSLYKNKIGIDVIKKISYAILVFMNDADEGDIQRIFFPCEDSVSRKKCVQDAIGLYIFQDEFGKAISQNFDEVIREIEKFII